MRLKSVVTAVLTIVCALLCGAAQADWLSSQAQSDGSYSTTSDIATPTQATSEAVRALRFLGRGTEVAAGDAYRAGEDYRDHHDRDQNPGRRGDDCEEHQRRQHSGLCGRGADGLRLEPDGALYAMLGGAGGIVRYDLSTGATTTVVSGFPVPCYNFRIVAPNEYYAMCPAQVMHLLPDGTTTPMPGLGGGFSDMSLASNGTLYFLDANNNQVLSGPPAGPFTQYVGGWALQLPAHARVRAGRLALRQQFWFVQHPADRH